MSTKSIHISNKAKRGFTLIELLVVIAIIGLLASIVAVAVNSARKKARDTRRKADLRTLQTAIEAYASDTGSYPSTNTTSNPWWSTCNYWDDGGNKGVNDWIPGLVSGGYIAKLPLDPVRGSNTAGIAGPIVPGNGGDLKQTYCYIYRSDGTDYKVALHCGVESEVVTSSHPFYKGNDNWNCPDYNYAIYTAGASSW